MVTRTPAAGAGAEARAPAPSLHTCISEIRGGEREQGPGIIVHTLPS